MKETENVVVKGYVDMEQLWKLRNCLVCESALICHAKSINDRIAKIGLGEITRRIQGRYFFSRNSR